MKFTDKTAIYFVYKFLLTVSKHTLKLARDDLKKSLKRSDDHLFIAG